MAYSSRNINNTIVLYYYTIIIKYIILKDIKLMDWKTISNLKFTISISIHNSLIQQNYYDYVLRIPKFSLNFYYYDKYIS
jgi:hypothetical protein